MYSVSWQAGPPRQAAEPLLQACSFKECASRSSWEAGSGEDALRVCAAGLEFMQSITRRSQAEAVELRFRSVGAQPASVAPVASVSVSGGSLCGLLRTVAQECPQLLCSGLDGEVTGSGVGRGIEYALVTDTAGRASDGQGVAERSGYLAAPLLAPSRVLQSPEPMQLVPRPRGSLHSLAQQAVQSSLGGSLVLGPGECQLRVMCVGLNFRDVLNVLGMYPGDPGDPGGDCSGVVAKVGSADSRLSVGLPAFGLAIGSLGTHVNVVEDLMVPMPPGVSFDAAATAPTVFVTVELAYRQAAGLRSGERVLVHAATGGVGLAATQVVTAAGADVYATAGSSYKRALLRGMSVQDVASSRDIRYVTEVGGLVGGIGIVLNSLTSPGMVPATIAGVQLGGRMVEIGKRDIWSPGAVRCLSLIHISEPTRR